MKTPSVSKIQGADNELRFWREFVHSKQFSTWLDPKQPTPELLPVVVETIRKEGGKVLDVGSGVVSVLRGTVPDENLFAADLLGDEYRKLFDYKKHGIRPPLAVPAEKLTFFEEFQVVHIRNAFDHCQAPYVAWQCLKSAVRPGGLLIVSGFEGEGSYLRKAGMHQWDLSLEGDVLSMTPALDPKLVSLNLHPFQVAFAQKTKLVSGRTWITWIARKSPLCQAS